MAHRYALSADGGNHVVSNNGLESEAVGNRTEWGISSGGTPTATIFRFIEAGYEGNLSEQCFRYQKSVVWLLGALKARSRRPVKRTAKEESATPKPH